MNELNLSKSKYCRGKMCNKMYWMDKYKPEENKSKVSPSIFDNGQKVGELAKGLFGKYEDVEFNKDLNIMIDTTNELLKNKPNIITEASFKFDNNFCSVDILKNDEDGVEIYEVKSSTEEKDIYLDDISYQYYILFNLGFNVKKACLVYVNKKYIKHGEIDIKQFFIIEDETEVVKSMQDDVKTNIEKLNEFMKKYDADTEPDVDIGMQCETPYRAKCDYWEYCTRNLPKPNVFDVHTLNASQKYKLYYEGKVSFEDLLDEKLSNRYKQQIEFEVNNLEPKIDKDAIKELLQSLKYPLYFIDFESFMHVIPEYDGTHAYQQLCFQYSLHIVDHEGAEVEHKEFLADPDDDNFMRHFAESMLNDMPKSGTMIVYNRVFEETRIKELAEMFPDLSDRLLKLLDNLVDFMVPFRRREYYTKEMEGSYSIKYVLPAIYPDDPELNYHNLPLVHHGTEASETFIAMKNMTGEEREKTRQGLLVYCGLDTYALVKLWEKFKEVVEE